MNSISLDLTKYLSRRYRRNRSQDFSQVRLLPYDGSASRRARQPGLRWSVGVGALLLGTILQFPSTALASSVEQFVVDFNQRLSSELGRTDLSDTERQRRFAVLLDVYVDLDAASALVLGARWEKASPQDRAQFCDAFRDYLVRNFAARVHGIGERSLHITGLVWDGPNVTVASELSSNHTDPLAVEWRLAMGGDAGWRLSNVTVAGLSMAAIMRAQFDAVPDQGGTGLTPVVGLLRNQQGG
jgi:phospholipid transport system substrate-binding protein